VSFFQSVKNCLENYCNGNGRASRSEYWFFYLFGFLVDGAGQFMDNIFHTPIIIHLTYPIDIPLRPIDFILNAAFVVPFLAVCVRRLHDFDRKGSWLWIGLTIIGIIPLLVWFCRRGTEGKNRFGKDPLA